MTDYDRFMEFVKGISPRIPFEEMGTAQKIISFSIGDLPCYFVFNMNGDFATIWL